MSSPNPWYAEDHPCCNWHHVRFCGKADESGEPVCACGCSAYDERCGGGEWWLPGPMPKMPIKR